MLNPGALAIIVPVILWVIACVVVLIVPGPRTLTYVNALTEEITYSVINPELSAFSATGVLIDTSADGQETQSGCTMHRFMPGLHSRMAYQLHPNGMLVVAETRRDAGSKPTGEPSRILLVRTRHTANAPDATPCQHHGTLRLPVLGPTRIGGNGEFRLLHGQFGVYGRSILDGSLYPTSGRLLPIPPHSTVISGSLSSDNAQTLHNEDSMTGTAILEADGLNIRLTTDSDQLQLLSPSAGAATVPIKVRNFSRLFDDPAILTMQAYFFLLLFLLQRASSIASWVRARQTTPGENNTSHGEKSA